MYFLFRVFRELVYLESTAALLMLLWAHTPDADLEHSTSQTHFSTRILLCSFAVVVHLPLSPYHFLTAIRTRCLAVRRLAERWSYIALMSFSKLQHYSRHRYYVLSFSIIGLFW